MKILKLFLFFIAIGLVIISFNSDSSTLGDLWRNYHVNSLIGLQKLIENIFIPHSLNIDLWYNIILPLLKLKLLFILSLFNLLLIYFIKK
jgi:hypothetical protein